MKCLTLGCLASLLVVLAPTISAQVYSVSTLAGAAGSLGYIDAQGADARFNQPVAVAVDGAGNVLVVAANNAALRKITPSGVVSTVAALPAGGAGVVLDGAGNAYVTDSSSHVIRRVAPDGSVSLFAGQPGTRGNANGSGEDARFNEPRGIAIDGGGNLFVSDTGNHTIRRVTSAGVVTTLAGLAGIGGNVDGPGPLARFNTPLGLAVDSSGCVYVADSGNRTVRKITATGEVSTLAGSPSSYNYNDGVGSAAGFSALKGLAVDATGALLATDAGTRTIRKITSAGVVSTIAGLASTSGSSDGVGSAARFQAPQGIAVDASGNFYIADSGSHTMRKGTFIPLPVTIEQPADVTVAAGADAVFSVVAAGPGPLTHAWQRQAQGAVGFATLGNDSGYAGVSSPTLTVQAVSEAMEGDQFRCLISGDGGTVTSATARLTVTAAPVITSANTATYYVGQPGSFRFSATGLPAPAFSVSAGVLPAWATLDATTGVLSGTPPNTTGSPRTVTVAATNASGTTTQSFTITVQAAPVAPAIPPPAAVGRVVASGQSLTLSISASGTGPLSYQWKRNGLALPGATATNYTIPSASARDGGYYQVVATGPGGTTSSAPIFVLVSYPSVEVVAWGSDLAVPTGLGAVVAIASGAGHNLALKSDGTVIGWGTNVEGQAAPPAGLSNVVAVAAGADHSLALKADGTVRAWGYNGSGQADVPAGLAGVVAIAAGQFHSLALKQDGTVVAWGSNSWGQCTVPAGLSDVVAIAAGYRHSLALKANGNVVSWGDTGGYTIPASVRDVVAIAASSSASMAAKTDGSVVVWGSSGFGLGNVPAGLSGVTSVALSYYQAIALKADGTLAVWGDNYNSPVALRDNLRSVVAISAGASLRLALRNASNDLAPTIPTPPASATVNLGQSVTFNAAATAGTAAINYQWMKDSVAISGATKASYTVSGVTAASAGSYYVVASNSLGSVTSGIATLTVNATPVVSATTGGRYPLAIGQDLTLALASTISPSATVQWRRNRVPIPGATGRSYTISNATLGHAGYYQAVYDDGSGAVFSAAIFVPVVPAVTQVFAWGYSSNETAVPVGMERVIAVAARGSANLALKADGTVTRWGGYSSTVPADLANVVAVATGASHFLALRADGTVIAWPLGSSDPAAWVPEGLTQVVAVSAGSGHSLALKGDGTVVAWGTATYGATAVPAGLSDVIAIAAGDGFSLVLRSDGSVVGWGNNYQGQASVPLDLAEVVGIAASSWVSLALKRDGTVAAWGSSDYGLSVVPPGLSDVVAISAGTGHSVAVKADGTITGWGYSYYGQTIPPPGLNGVFAAAAGNNHSVVVRDATDDGSPAIMTQPQGATAWLGQNVVLRVAADAGTAPMTYQWRKAGVSIPGATSTNFRIPVMSPAQAGTYDVVVSNYLGSAVSSPAILTVNPVAAVTTSPTGRYGLAVGQSLTLNGATALPGTVAYQWRRNGQPIPGATSASHVISNATWASGGTYQLVATNAIGSAASAPIYLAVPVGAQVRAWGDNSRGQTSVPAAVMEPIAIAAGQYHNLVLESDGTVVAWGSNTAGQCNVPPGLADVAAVAAGNNFSLALLDNGTVVTWGAINYTPSALTRAIAVAASPFSSSALALKADGTVIEWDASSVRVDTAIGGGEVVAIAMGGNHRVALMADGAVVQWGSGSSFNPAVVIPAGANPVVAIASGNEHVLALKSDGTVAAWDYSNPPGGIMVPTGLGGVRAIAGGSGVSFAVKSNGSVVTWGQYTSSLALGAGGLAPAYAISAGSSHALALRDASGDTAPAITTQPLAQAVTMGQSITLSVTATGIPPPTYQWYRNGIVISGATAESYTFTPYSTSDQAAYSVTVSNALGSITSDVILVTVNPDASVRGLLAGVARAEMDSELVGTFTIEGTASKQVLVRAVGPALTLFGMGGVLADPRISVTTAGGVVVAANDDWGLAANASQIATVSAQVGAHALPAGGKDAAILRSFAPGTYHVEVTAGGNSAGAVMLGIYDAESAPRMVYLATSAFAGVGNKVLVQGFNVAGVATGRSYLIRALGPSLGAREALPDPALAIFDPAGLPVGANDNWGGDGSLVSLAAAVGAMPLPAASKDAAVNFVPAGAGSYAIQVSDTTGATGRVLLEIFEADALRAGALTSAIVAQPQATTVLPGSPATFGVVAIGNPTPTFQWRKNGAAIPGASDATLVISSAQASDAGDYTVVVTNPGGTVTSSPATLGIVAQQASHGIIGHGYIAGSTVTISNTLHYTGTAAGIGWQVTVPPGWSYTGGGGMEGDVKPMPGTTDSLEWAWTSPPPSPVNFTYTLSVPASESGSTSLAATAIVQVGGSPLSVVPTPGVLTIAPADLHHNADTNQNYEIGLTELLRVIELYNTRNGTLRTGAYAVDETNEEDGFGTDPARLNTAVVTLARYHTADTNHDGKLGLTELLRVIELYNFRSGTVRTGQYRIQAGTEDGFAPGY